MEEQQVPDHTSEIAFRLSSTERDVTDLKEQFQRYVPVRENDLQLKNIHDSVERIEIYVQQARKQLDDVNSKLGTQEREAQERDAKQRESQAALQIKVLWGTVSTIITILTSILIGYVTHLFH
jgi:predicted  nucleic acid-binding Zn-ribbon protein